MTTSPLAATLPAAINPWVAAAMIAAVVLTSTTGEVLTAAAMKSIGDLDMIRAHSGLKGAIRAVVTCPLFYAGVFFLALAFCFSFFSLSLSFLGLMSCSRSMVM